jgi:hypothetical protein
VITHIILHYEYLNEPNTVMFHIRLMSLRSQVHHANQTPPKCDDTAAVQFNSSNKEPYFSAPRVHTPYVVVFIP